MKVVRRSVLIVLAIGFVVLVVIGNKVIQRKSVMRRNEVDARPGFTPSPIKQHPPKPLSREAISALLPHRPSKNF